MGNQSTKFEAFSFSHSRHILGELNIENGSYNMNKPFSGTVRHL